MTKWAILLLLFLWIFPSVSGPGDSSDDDFQLELSQRMDRMRISRGGAAGTSGGAAAADLRVPTNLQGNLGQTGRQIAERGGHLNVKFMQRSGSPSAPITKRNMDRSGQVVLKNYHKLPDPKRVEYVKKVDKGEWDVYYNTYHMASTWNKAFGKFAPALHGAVEFQGPGWPEGRREFSYDVPGFHAALREQRPREFGEYRYYKSKYMGKTRMNPQQIRRYADRLRRKKYGPNDFHITKRNCHKCATDFVEQTVGVKPPSRYNRLAKGLGKMGLNLLPLG